MKAVAILLIAMLLLLNGCGTSPAIQQPAGAIWQAQLIGGTGSASGLSFITAFTVNDGGSLTFNSFQFLNNGSCFPYIKEIPTASFANLQFISSTLQVTGTLSFTVTYGGNTLMLTGPMTGTATETGSTGNNTITFNTATITGTWTLTGSPECTLTNSDTSFTMTLCTSSTVCTPAT
jgi:hypothetical protein